MFSWIFLATAMSCQNEASSVKAITKVADGINHAAPTQKEIQISMKWLINNGLITKIGKKYDLTLTGKNIHMKATDSSNQITKIWASLTRHFTRITKGKEDLPEYSKELLLIIENGFGKRNTKQVVKSLKRLNHEFDSDYNMSARLIAALLKLSDNSIEKLEEAIQVCKLDWRDTLMSSGFGNDTNEHKNWISQQITKVNYDYSTDSSRELLVL